MSSLIEFFASLIAWQNMPFTAAVALGAVLFGVQALGVFGDHAEAEGSGAALEAGDTDALDGKSALAPGHDAGHLDHAPEGGASFLAQGLRALGVGRVPLALLLPIGLVGFGFSGLFASLILGGIGHDSATFRQLLFFPVLGLAVAGGLAVLKVVSRTFQAIVPEAIKTASDRLDLLGLIGIVKSGQVDGDFGQVKVTDAFGRPLEVACVALDPKRTAKYGEEVVLVDWDPAAQRFRVAPLELGKDDEVRRREEGRRRALELRSSKHTK